MRKQILLLLAALLLLSGCRSEKKPDTAALPHANTPADDGAAAASIGPTPAETAEPTVAASPVPEVTFTPEPTETPSPTPETITDEALDAGALDTFFDDSVLIGDSLTAGFSGYVKSRQNGDPSFLGGMRFMYASAYTLDTAYYVETGERYAWLKYRGQSYSVSDLVKAMEVRTAYLLLGVNDIQLKSVEENIAQLDLIVRNIQEKSPETKLVLITIPPVMKSYAAECRHPENIHDEVNAALRAYCVEHGLDYIELSDRVCGEDGFLRSEYCIDGKFHFDKAGNAEWVRAFREYARAQYDCGAWTPSDDAGQP